MKQSDTPVMSGFLNHSRFAPLVVVHNTMKCIAGIHVFISLWQGRWSRMCSQEAVLLRVQKVLVRLKESPLKGICLLRQVDVNSSERGEKSVYPEEGRGRGVGR